MTLRSIAARLDRLERGVNKIGELREINRLRAENSRLKEELENLRKIQLGENMQIKIEYIRPEPFEVDTTSLEALLSDFVDTRVRNAICRGYPREKRGRVNEKDLTIGEVLKLPKEELFHFRNFGVQTFKVLKQALEEHGYGKFVDNDHWLNTLLDSSIVELKRIKFRMQR